MFEAALILLIPLAVGCFNTLCSRKLPPTAAWAAALTALIAALTLSTKLYLQGGACFEASWGHGGSLAFSWLLCFDELNAAFVVLASFISHACLTYSTKYVEHGSQLYSGLLLLFTSGMIGCLMSVDMIAFYLFWELMVWSSYALIHLYGEGAEAPRAAMLYLLISHVASTTLLFGLLSLYALKGTFNLLAVKELGLDSPLEVFAAASVSIGLLIKMGVIPLLHVWLPDAHSEAPAPVSAMLSGLMIEVAAYGFLRILYGCWSLESLRSVSWLVWGCGLAMLSYTAILSFSQLDIKRFMAYSSINEMGLVVFALGLFAHGAAVAAVAHTLNHEIVKSLLFLYAGCIVHEVKVRNIRTLGDMLWFMPEASAAGLIGSLSIIGIPGLNIFVSELLIYMAGVDVGLLAPTVAAAVMMAVFSAAWLRFINRVMLTRRRLGRVRVSFAMLIPMFALALICLALGLHPDPLIEAAERAASVVS